MSHLRKWTLVLPAIAALAFLAHGTVQGGDEPATVVAEKRSFCVEVERPGTFVPTGGEEVELRLDAYSGELLVVEVAPQGTPVNTGDVIARIDTRAIEDQIRQAELDLRSAEVQYRSTVERAEIDEQAAERSLARARAGLERAQRSLEGWQKYELPFARRRSDLSEAWTQDGIEDQKDELAQLEAMYREDELTDATEEIVLKRSRRALARSIASQQLESEQRRYRETFTEPMQTETRIQAVEEQQESVDRMHRTQGLDRMGRDDARVRSEFNLDKARRRIEELRKDRELFTIRAPRTGILYHGSADDYGPGSNPPRHERGTRFSTRTPLFTIADPDRVEVALEIPEAKFASVRTGGAVRILPAAMPGKEWVGTLHVERFPSPKSGGRPEAAWDAMARIDRPLPGVYPGMRATLKIESETMDDAIVVPKAAVFGAGDEAHCWAAAPGAADFARVAVKLGPSDDKEVVVLSGVEAGSRLLLAEPAK